MQRELILFFSKTRTHVCSCLCFVIQSCIFHDRKPSKEKDPFKVLSQLSHRPHISCMSLGFCRRIIVHALASDRTSFFSSVIRLPTKPLFDGKCIVFRSMQILFSSLEMKFFNTSSFSIQAILHNKRAVTDFCLYYLVLFAY